MNILRKKIFESKGSEYTIEELGPNKFKHEGKIFEWVDFNFFSCRGKNLCGSIFKEHNGPCDNLIVMCTGNKGNRSSVNKYLKLLLQENYCVAIFDYNGLGHSDILPISYGFYESQDLKIFLVEINYRFQYKNLILWGWSMGTQTIL